MIKEYSVQNVRCGGCANTIKKALGEKLELVEVNLDVTPRVVSAEINSEEDEKFLIETLHKHGYPLVGEDSGIVDKAKSFVSCAIGKIG